MAYGQYAQDNVGRALRFDLPVTPPFRGGGRAPGVPRPDAGAAPGQQQLLLAPAAGRFPALVNPPPFGGVGQAPPFPAPLASPAREPAWRYPPPGANAAASDDAIQR